MVSQTPDLSAPVQQNGARQNGTTARQEAMNEGDTSAERTFLRPSEYYGVPELTQEQCRVGLRAVVEVAQRPEQQELFAELESSFPDNPIRRWHKITQVPRASPSRRAQTPALIVQPSRCGSLQAENKVYLEGLRQFGFGAGGEALKGMLQIKSMEQLQNDEELKVLDKYLQPLLPTGRIGKEGQANGHSANGHNGNGHTANGHNGVEEEDTTTGES